MMWYLTYRIGDRTIKRHFKDFELLMKFIADNEITSCEIGME